MQVNDDTGSPESWLDANLTLSKNQGQIYTTELQVSGSMAIQRVLRIISSKSDLEDDTNTSYVYTVSPG